MIKTIQSELKRNSSLKAKASIMKFVPSAEHVYGVRMPVLNDMAKKYQEGGFVLVNKLWKAGFFEERMLACRILIRIAKSDPEQTLRLIKKFGKDVTDWAICDCLGTQSIKKICKSHQNEILELSSSLVVSKRMWERRLALVLLVKFTRDGALRTAIQHIMNAAASDEEYYVKKAIVWLNRNFENRK